jgi:hypothetical protein
MNLINECTAWFTEKVLGLDVTYLRVLAKIDPDALTVLLASSEKETLIQVGAAEAGEKKSHAFTSETKQIFIRAEKVTQINYSFTESNYDAGDTLTITSGGMLKLSGLSFTSKTIYFDADKNNVTIEILELF